MITIIGAHGTIKDVDLFVQKLLEFSKQEKVVTQALDAHLVYGIDHLMSATRHALRACEQKTNATNSLALEILLYAAGERQIQKAISKIGVKKGKQTIAFVLVDNQKTNKRKAYDAVADRLLKTFKCTRDDKVLEGNIDTLKRFGITNQQLLTVPENKYGDLILEKIAMVDVIK